MAPPDIPQDDCRTRFLCADLFNCLSEKAHRCPFALPFGNGYFCKHPSRKVFSENDPSKTNDEDR